MSGQPTELRSLPTPTDAEASRLLADTQRAIDYYRVRELCPPLSKTTVYRLLHQGKLRAIRLDGFLLIEGASVREWIESGEAWRVER